MLEIFKNEFLLVELNPYFLLYNYLFAQLNDFLMQIKPLFGQIFNRSISYS